METPHKKDLRALCRQPSSFHQQQYQQQQEQLIKSSKKHIQRDGDSCSCCTNITCTFPIVLLQSICHSTLTWVKHSYPGNGRPKSFGKGIRNDFILRTDYIHLNHGSYGVAPTPVLQSRQNWLTQQETSPDLWFRTTVDPTYVATNEAAANFVGALATNMALVENATTGLNNVIKSVSLTSADAILVNTYTYGSIVDTCERHASVSGATVLTLDILAPIASKQSIVTAYDQFLTANPNVKLAIIDHISSSSATLFPLAELIDVCKRHNVMVCVDGAHAPGQVVSLNLEQLGQLGMDFYVGNLHKWAYSNRGSGIMWVHPNHHSYVRPVITSFPRGGAYPETDFRSWFVYSGTQDRSSLYTIQAALDYITLQGGVSAIVNYNAALLDTASTYLVNTWGPTSWICPTSPDMVAPCMRLVKIPTLAEVSERDVGGILQTQHNITVATMYAYNTYWFRLSANIYNTMDDYIALADAVILLMPEEARRA